MIFVEKERDLFAKVVDPYSKKTHWVSKHLAPYGEESGVIAEIRDEI